MINVRAETEVRFADDVGIADGMYTWTKMTKMTISQFSQSESILININHNELLKTENVENWARNRRRDEIIIGSPSSMDHDLPNVRHM
jgi:hypothetical protein